MVTEEELKKPLETDLEYYDATPSIEALAKEVRDLKKLTILQGEINLKVIGLLSEAMERIEILQGTGQKPSPLILPPRLQ